MSNGLDLTQSALMELIKSFKCAYSVMVFNDVMTVTCVMKSGMIMYTICDFGNTYKVVCQAFVGNKPLEPREIDLDNYLDVCNLLIDDLTAIDEILEVEDAIFELLEESDDE